MNPTCKFSGFKWVQGTRLSSSATLNAHGTSQSSTKAQWLLSLWITHRYATQLPETHNILYPTYTQPVWKKNEGDGVTHAPCAHCTHVNSNSCMRAPTPHIQILGIDNSLDLTHCHICMIPSWTPQTWVLSWEPWHLPGPPVSLHHGLFLAIKLVEEVHKCTLLFDVLFIRKITHVWTV